MLKKLYSESVAKTGIETLPYSYPILGIVERRASLLEREEKETVKNTTLYENGCVQCIENAADLVFEVCRCFMH